MEFSYHKIRRSQGQYKRHAGVLSVGTRTNKPFPYFLLQDRLRTLQAVNPAKKVLVSRYAKRILSATTGTKQNRLYAELIEKFNKK